MGVSQKRHSEKRQRTKLLGIRLLPEEHLAFKEFADLQDADMAEIAFGLLPKSTRTSSPAPRRWHSRRRRRGPAPALTLMNSRSLRTARTSLSTLRQIGRKIVASPVDDTLNTPDVRVKPFDSVTIWLAAVPALFAAVQLNLQVAFP